MAENTHTNNQNQSLRLYADIEGLDQRHKYCGFKNFNVLPENQKQYEACLNWNCNETMTLTGKTGTGKTHLAVAMLKNFPKIEVDPVEAFKVKEELAYYIRNDIVYYTPKGKEMGKEQFREMLDKELYKYRRARCLILPVVKMFAQLNNSVMSGEGKLDLLEKYSGTMYDCILFDDLGAEKLTDAKRENLYYIIDERYRKMLPSIITSNFTIEEISAIEPRIASRLAEMGKILLFSGEDYRISGCKMPDTGNRN